MASGKKGKIIDVRGGKAIKLEDLTKGNILMASSREELIIGVKPSKERGYIIKTIAKDRGHSATISVRMYIGIVNQGRVTRALSEKRDYKDEGYDKPRYGRYNNTLNKARAERRDKR